uniref:Tegument protein pp65 n=1 Tax=Human betaherpesvirus 6A TaxID=32603 RepID=A0A219XZP8_9BETA|nr:tegument protein pp65 [Human betaherpesvirus 6A]
MQPATLQWSSYVLQLRVTTTAILKPGELKLFKCGLGITPPSSAVVCTCRDESSFASSPFTYIDPKDYGNIPFAVQNISDLDLDLSRLPIVLNIFALSYANVNISNLPVQRIEAHDRHIIPHGQCDAKFIIYGPLTRIKINVADIRWIEETPEEPTRYLFKADIWVNLQNTPLDQIFKNADIEFISHKNVYISRILLCGNLLILKAIYENDYLRDDNFYPEQLNIQISLTPQIAEITMSQNQETLLKCNTHSITVCATKNIISNMVTPLHCSFNTIFNSNSNFTGFFIPKLLPGISTTTGIWDETRPLYITMKAYKKNRRINYSQDIGRVFFFPKQILPPGNNVEFNWAEISKIYVNTESPNGPVRNTVTFTNQAVLRTPSLTTVANLTPDISMGIFLNSLRVAFDNAHMVPLHFCLKPGESTRMEFMPPGTPQNLTILEGDVGIHFIPCHNHSHRSSP